MQLRRRLRESDLKKKQLKLNVLDFKKRHALQLKLQKLRESDLKKRLQLQLRPNVLGFKKRRLRDKELRKNED